MNELQTATSIDNFSNIILSEKRDYQKYILQRYTWLEEKEIATHSSTLAWKIPWMEEPRRLQLMGLQRVGHNWVTSFYSSVFLSSFWRRKWQPIPVFLPGESHGQRGLVGYSLWGCKESDMTNQLTHTHTITILKICVIFWEYLCKTYAAWCAAAHGVTKSGTWLSNWTRTKTNATQISFKR